MESFTSKENIKYASSLKKKSFFKITRVIETVLLKDSISIKFIKESINQY